MSYTKLYTYRTLKFGGVEKAEEPSYTFLGVPFDFTSTYRPGSRLGPSAIREASINLEGFSLRSGIEVEDVSTQDIGDLEVMEDVEETLRRLQLVLGEVLESGKKPIVLGGEHTVTFGCADTFKDAAILDFDAHMDCRDEYLGSDLSHATFMRRLCEKRGSESVVEVGVRAVCKEELSFASETGLRYITSPEVAYRGPKSVAEEIREIISGFSKVYVTVDMDVLDPAYAPAVGNPVPEGISPTTLLDILKEVCDERVAGFDVVEVAPQYDSGITALQASHIIFNMIAFMEEAREAKP